MPETLAARRIRLVVAHLGSVEAARHHLFVATDCRVSSYSVDRWRKGTHSPSGEVKKRMPCTRWHVNTWLSSYDSMFDDPEPFDESWWWRTKWVLDLIDK